VNFFGATIRRGNLVKKSTLEVGGGQKSQHNIHGSNKKPSAAGGGEWVYTLFSNNNSSNNGSGYCYSVHSDPTKVVIASPTNFVF
jgi:hypothetical protein